MAYLQAANPNRIGIISYHDNITTERYDEFVEAADWMLTGAHTMSLFKLEDDQYLRNVASNFEQLTDGNFDWWVPTVWNPSTILNPIQSPRDIKQFLQEIADSYILDIFTLYNILLRRDICAGLFGSVATYAKKAIIDTFNNLRDSKADFFIFLLGSMQYLFDKIEGIDYEDYNLESSEEYSIHKQPYFSVT